MVISIARQSIVLKCIRQKSVMVGNYEFYYTAGLLKKLYGLQVSGSMQPQELSDAILPNLDGLAPADDKEKYLIGLIRYYEPQEGYDEQMAELFAWGEQEQEPWVVNTSYRGPGDRIE